ncbi:hypothetical protein H8958_013891 [Nasalis larvatus]
MVPKVKKEAPVPTKAQAEAKALKAEKAVLKDIHSHTQKKDPHHLPSSGPRHHRLGGTLNILGKVPPGETSLATMPLPSPPTTELAMKKKEDNILVFIVNDKVNKHHIKQAVKKFYDINVAKINTLISLRERRLLSNWFLTMLWILPTKLGS